MRALKPVRQFERSVRAARARRADPLGVALAERLQRERLTFLATEPLLDLRRRGLEMERRGVPGIVLEAGCALGGSAIMLAASKERERRLQVQNVFGVIPPPGEKDGDDVHARYGTIAAGQAAGFDGDVYYGYQPELKQKVARSFEAFGYPCAAHNVSLVEGLFEATVQPDGPVALAHLDGDWYESVRVCLDRVWPALSVGGVIVVDDYDAWSGCRRAVDEFLSSHPECQVEHRSRLHLLRI